jgi:hypothetical protein
VEEGAVYGYGPAETQAELGAKVKGYIVGRDGRTGRLFFGQTTMVFRKHGGQLAIEVPAGVPLWGRDGRFGLTKKKFTMPLTRQ